MNPLPGSHLIRSPATLVAAPKSADARNTRLAHPQVSGTPKKQRPRKQALPMFRFPGLSPAPASATGLSQGHPSPGSPKSFREQLARRSGGLRIRRAAASERRGKPGKTLTGSDSDSFRGGGEKSASRGDGQPPNGFLSSGNPSRRVSDILTSLSQETALPQSTRMLLVSGHSHNHGIFSF